MLLTNYKPEAFSGEVEAMEIFARQCLAWQTIADPGVYLPELPEWAPAHIHSFKVGFFSRIIVDGDGLSSYIQKTVVGSIYA